MYGSQNVLPVQDSDMVGH